MEGKVGGPEVGLRSAGISGHVLMKGSRQISWQETVG